MAEETRRAAALRYDPTRDQAPRVVAAGEKLIAEAIINRAHQHGVPIYEDPDLAAALVKLQVGTEIPPNLYRAIAQVLVFVHGLNETKGAEKARHRSDDAALASAIRGQRVRSGPP